MVSRLDKLNIKMQFMGTVDGVHAHTGRSRGRGAVYCVHAHTRHSGKMRSYEHTPLHHLQVASNNEREMLDFIRKQYS